MVNCLKLSFILLILQSINAFTQNYKQVLKGDTIQWNYLSDSRCFDCFLTIIYKAFGDTIFNDLKYRKLYAIQLDHNNFELYGYIREDTLNGRIYLLSYAYNCIDEPCLENIVYDVSLKEGDTLVYYPYKNRIEHLIVKSVDYSNSTKSVSFIQTNLKFIEGIGSSREFYIDWLYNGGLSELLCKYEDNIIVFQRNVFNFDTCYVPLTGSWVDKKEYELFSLTPNPAYFNSWIQINSNSNQELFIQILTLSGINLYSERFSKSFTIRPSDFTYIPGLYLYKVKDRKGNFIKNGLLLIL